jgi:hypothetical protein
MVRKWKKVCTYASEFIGLRGGTKLVRPRVWRIVQKLTRVGSRQRGWKGYGRARQQPALHTVVTTRSFARCDV